MGSHNRLTKWISCGLSCLILMSTIGCRQTPQEPTPPNDTTTTTTPTTSATSTSTTTTSATTTTTTTTTATVSRADTAVSADGADARLEQIIEDAVSVYGGVGVQVAVISGGELSLTAQYGWAEKNTSPMTADSLLRIASPSKTVVSMIVHHLIDDGLLSLDDDISDHLGVTVRNPNHPNKPITVRMLLEHTSSLKDADYLPSLSALQKHLTSGKAFTSARPGANFVYNNFAFGVLGVVCECAAGRSFTDLAEEFFFEPMGITASFLAERVPLDDLAVIYQSNGSVGLSKNTHRKFATYHKEPGYTMRCFAGGLIISAGDYARLLTVLMNDGIYNGQALLSKKATNSIHEVQFKRGAIQQCLPVWRQDGLYGQSPLYYHTGSAYGIYSLYVYNPKNDTGVVVITTGSSGQRDSNGVYAVCGRIVDNIYDDSDIFFDGTFV